MTQYISRLDTFSKQLEDNLKGTPWTDTNNPNTISLKQLSKMLMMSKIIHKSQGSMTEKLYQDLNSTVQLSQVDYMVKRYIEKDPHSNQYVLPVRPKSPSPERRSRLPSLSGDRSYSHRARSNSRPRISIKCYSCSKMGHTARECYSQQICGNCQYQGHRENKCRNQSWCAYHEKIGHKTRDCRRRRSEKFFQTPTE